MTINEISYQIRGAIYDVYKILGPGLLESVYEEAHPANRINFCAISTIDKPRKNNTVR